MAKWTNTYETEPDSNDSAGSGSASVETQLEGIKQEVRRRASVEHDFTDGTPAAPSGATSGAAKTEDGRHRTGSARAFVQAAAPTQLEEFDYDSNTGGTGNRDLDIGRVWYDSDDSYKPYVYDGAVWQQAESHLATPNDPLFSEDTQTTNTQGSATFDWTPLTANPSIAIPAAGSSVRPFRIEVFAYISTTHVSGAGESWLVQLQEDTGSGFAVVATAHLFAKVSGEGKSSSLHRVINSATVSTTYTYKLTIVPTNDTVQIIGASAEARITVLATPWPSAGAL